MMYEYNDILQLKNGAENWESALDLQRYGVSVYAGTDPDISGPHFVIDPKDGKGMELFRAFCKEMAAHYKTLI